MDAVGDGDGLVWFASIYPGFVVAAHAFPNQDPTNALWDRSRETGSLLRVTGYPLALVSMLYWTVGYPLGVVG
ncbi:MAG: hypothetical protein ABEH86_03695 [Haloarcula sp.]